MISREMILILWLFFLPSLEVIDGLLHTLLVVADHVLVHVGIVGADVLLCAAVWHRAEAQRGVLLRRLLELHEEEVMRMKQIQQVRRKEEATSVPTPACTFLSDNPDTVSMYSSWIMKAARLAV